MSDIEVELMAIKCDSIINDIKSTKYIKKISTNYCTIYEYKNEIVLYIKNKFENEIFQEIENFKKNTLVVITKNKKIPLEVKYNEKLNNDDRNIILNYANINGIENIIIKIIK